MSPPIRVRVTIGPPSQIAPAKSTGMAVTTIVEEACALLEKGGAHQLGATSSLWDKDGTAVWKIIAALNVR